MMKNANEGTKNVTKDEQQRLAKLHAQAMQAEGIADTKTMIPATAEENKINECSICRNPDGKLKKAYFWLYEEEDGFEYPYLDKEFYCADGCSPRDELAYAEDGGGSERANDWNAPDW